MKATYIFLPINDPRFDDQEWARYFDLLFALHKRFRSICPADSWQDLKKRQLSFMEKEDTLHREVIYTGYDPMGWIAFRVRGRGTPQEMAILRFDALYAEIPELLGAEIARRTAAWMERYSCDVLYVPALDLRAATMLRNWEAEELSRFNEYVLAVDSANEAVMQEWLDTIPDKNRGLRLEFFIETPEKYMRQLAEALTMFLEDMPAERESRIPHHISEEELRKNEQWRAENDMPSYKGFILDGEDRLVAVSVAEINKKDASDIRQALTGVIRDYRGRGLAKWLKAAMFFKLQNDFPNNRTITTHMRAVNEPIQHLNTLMGYRFECEGIEFQITREKLMSFLERQG